MNTTYCQNCGSQLQDANIRFCPNCGSSITKSNSQEIINKANELPPDIILIKAKLKSPAIAIIINAAIVLMFILIGLMMIILMQPERSMRNNELFAVATIITLLIISIPLLSFSIYSALLMMKVRKHSYAIAGSIITILSGFIFLTGLPIGIWAIIVLLKPDTKTAFTD